MIKFEQLPEYGRTFRWLVKASLDCIRFYAKEENIGGSVLVATFHECTLTLTPKDAAKMIRKALAKGWDFQKKGTFHTDLWGP